MLSIHLSINFCSEHVFLLNFSIFFSLKNWANKQKNMLRVNINAQTKPEQRLETQLTYLRPTFTIFWKSLYLSGWLLYYYQFHILFKYNVYLTKKLSRMRLLLSFYITDKCWWFQQELSNTKTKLVFTNYLVGYICEGRGLFWLQVWKFFSKFCKNLFFAEKFFCNQM